MAFCNEDINTIFKELNSSENGLNSDIVEINKNKYGSNITEKQKRVSFFVKFLLQFKNIMIVILLFSAVVSCTMAVIHNDYENLFEGLLIFAIVIINSIVGVIQEQKAENALNALAKRTLPNALITRNKTAKKISIEEIVVGDIISLKAGDYIPADIRIIDCSNFKCDESSLTGESQAVEKTNKVILKRTTSISEQENMCFSGTTVAAGNATGIVVATGKNTEIGKIAKILNISKKEKTPLEKNIDRIGKVISIIVLAIVVIVFSVQILLNKNISFLDALLTAVALAVAAIPESLPAVITIIMALGVQKLAKQNAIVKKLSAVETLGCCNIICTDKTGTITQNKMSVSHVCSSLNLYDSKITPKTDLENIHKIFAVCNNLKQTSTNELSGDATEVSIGNFFSELSMPFLNAKKNYNIINENEFNSAKKMMSVLCEKDGTKFVFAKGAIDYILPKCTHYHNGNETQPLSNNIKNKILKQNETVCKNGERVIAFAMKNDNTDQQDTNLVFVGFIGIIDPPRKGVKESIKLCKKAGLKTIMITGDHPTTAFAIASQVGIAKTEDEVITGTFIDNLSDKEFSKIINKYSVFARVTPEHKLKIVKALKAQGNIVAMTGDGINDAPSIKTANIGLCMGISGTDVTKAAADIIIADDNFSTIVSAVKEGRGIYQNITKTILFLISTNLVEVLGLFVTSLMIPNAIFLTPSQILFINLVTDSLPAFALGIEPVSKTIMDSPPRNAKSSILSGTTGTSILLEGFFQTLVVLIMFVIANNKYGNTTASTMSFLTICLMQIIHAINCKTEKSIFKINIFKNSFFNFSFLVLLGLILAIYFIAPLATIFTLSPLSKSQWLYVCLTSVSIIPVVEICKLFTTKKEM